MGSGNSPVGQVPASVITDDEIHGDTKVYVNCWWTSADSGAEIVTDDSRIILDDDEAFHMARCLLRAIQPAKDLSPDAFGRWVARVKEVADDTIRRAEDTDDYSEVAFERRTLDPSSDKETSR
jgi:hypothetical protein